MAKAKTKQIEQTKPERSKKKLSDAALKENKQKRDVFNEMKESLGLSNDDLADIVKLQTGTVKNQVSPYSEKVSTWMRAFVYMYERQRKLEDEIKQTDALNRKLIMDNKRSIMRNATKAKVSETEG